MPERYQLLPPLTDDEYKSLREDIAAHGIRVPVDVDEDGEILDGHHRHEIATALDIDCPTRVITGYDEAGKRDYALAVNLHRRALSIEQRRELVARLYGDGMTQPEIAAATGVPQQTISRDLAVTQMGNSDPSRGGRPRLDRDAEASPARPALVDAEGDDRVIAALAKYPELAWFAGQGQDDRVIRNAAFLDSYREPEFAVRRRALAATITAEQREAANPTPPPEDPGPDYKALAGEIFAAVNQAARLTARLDGPTTLAAAAPHIDGVTASMWAESYARFADTLNALAGACRPKIRRVK